MINQERWQELQERLRQKFSDFHLEIKDLAEPPLHQEYAYFSLPHQELRLIWTKKPRVLDKKTHYSNRIGGETTINYQYAADEYVFTLDAEINQGGTWLKTDLNELITYFN